MKESAPLLRTARRRAHPITAQTSGAMICTRPEPIPSRSRPTKIRVTEPRIRIDMTKSNVFMETPKQRPMRKPAISVRRIVNAPLSNTDMHNNQSRAQRLPSGIQPNKKHDRWKVPLEWLPGRRRADKKAAIRSDRSTRRQVLAVLEVLDSAIFRRSK